MLTGFAVYRYIERKLGCKHSMAHLLTSVSDPNTHDLMAVVDDEELVPSAVVYPSSTEEVQKIVLWANKYKIPIFPISMGRNCTYKYCLRTPVQKPSANQTSWIRRRGA